MRDVVVLDTGLCTDYINLMKLMGYILYLFLFLIWLPPFMFFASSQKTFELIQIFLLLFALALDS